MHLIISFIQKYRYLILFTCLQIIAISLTIRNHNFHKSKFLNSTNFITGSIYKNSNNITDYLNLKEHNEILFLENTKLKNQISFLKSFQDTILEKTIIDSLNYQQKFSYISAKIIKNEYHKPNNILLIDKGAADGITKEMAVYNSKGIIGITEETSNGYTRIQSILNKNSKINAKFKNDSNYFGPLIWDGKDYNTVQLTDIPRQANAQKGDTIITSGRSTIFPEGIPIGVVIDHSNYAKINVKLFNDMSNLRHVYVVKNLHQLELKELDNE